MFSKSEIDSIFDEYNEITVSSTAKLSEIKTKDLTDSTQEDVSHYIEYIKFQINKIDLVLDKIEHVLDNYNQLDIHIESYELSAMERELILLRKEYSSLI
ncbi:MAG: hypothetical protein Q7U35_05375 [Methanobacteriaceae archaeon]|nr:hypothetical protein [Methanobacteriaceae archaeon]MDP2835525.1 hypothetical protein [Methanobacteriaceae archaeon]MDP3035430.1 hypothetical protein [Methanobacteriaceae archaeon]MDP3485185.1 hypothetical protein [Methanobacteriaceae archaeon]MDP3622636.1 hypothetical protein [Methanobacteriaceae archaeon]